LAAYPETLTRAQAELSPHQIAFYLRDLAANLHSFYFAERVLVDDARLRRLASL
jgi:arginyl-tRNA synthetase